MSPVSRHLVRPGNYSDSVVLMQLQQSLVALPEVIDAAAVMATQANRELLRDAGLLPADIEELRADDLLIVVQATSGDAAQSALEQVDDLLRARRPASTEDYRPASLSSALTSHPDAAWVLVSIPGEHAAEVAREALVARRNVFLYSDNVTPDQEIELKRLAWEQGNLVMGPDCGTAYVGGAGLGFANRVRSGVVGLVAASGTGLQLVASRLHSAGVGVSTAIGTGGRDLSAAVGGFTTLQGLELLNRDPATQVIVLISKPPAAGVATKVLAAARSLHKPVVVNFLGDSQPARRVGNLHFACGLEDAAHLALQLLQGEPPHTESNESDDSIESSREPADSPGALRGLFAGGTLAQELWQGLSKFLGPIPSNLSSETASLDAETRHRILDLGADEYTLGRPHPMLDGAARLDVLRQELENPEVRVVLMDLVLGDGAESDPAEQLALAVRTGLDGARQQGRALDVAILVIGTDEDPQGSQQQRTLLEESGVVLCDSMEAMLEFALQRTVPTQLLLPAPVKLDQIGSPLTAINVGLESFRHSLAAQGAHAVQVDWRPRAGGDAQLTSILDRLRG